MAVPLCLVVKAINRIRKKVEIDDQVLGVVDQMRKSMHKKNRLAMIGGGILGGFVPAASFEIAHYEVQARPMMYLLVAAALMFSAMSVYDFAKVAFKKPLKALGFVGLLEGVLVFVYSDVVAYAGLALLVIINAVAAGNALALDQKKARIK